MIAAIFSVSEVAAADAPAPSFTPRPACRVERADDAGDYIADEPLPGRWRIFARLSRAGFLRPFRPPSYAPLRTERQPSISASSFDNIVAGLAARYCCAFRGREPARSGSPPRAYRRGSDEGAAMLPVVALTTNFSPRRPPLASISMMRCGAQCHHYLRMLHFISFDAHGHDKAPYLYLLLLARRYINTLVGITTHTAPARRRRAHDAATTSQHVPHLRLYFGSLMDYDTGRIIASRGAHTLFSCGIGVHAIEVFAARPSPVAILSRHSYSHDVFDAYMIYFCTPLCASHE